MTWIVLLIVAAVLGLCLTFVGLRGRRVDEHPLCRRCGFDLTGNPDAAVCNECGADLTRPRATKIGHRARRRLPLTLGLSLLVPCLLIGGVVGYVVLRGIDVQAYKPAWLLARELRSADNPTRDAAFAELGKRMTNGKLSDAATADSVTWVLDVQGDAAKAWDDQWGTLVEDARAAGKVGDEQWRRYARQGWRPVMSVRPDIRQGDVLPFRVEVDRHIGRGAAWQIYLSITDGRLDGRPVAANFAGGLTFAKSSTSSSYPYGAVVAGEATDALPVGKSRLGVNVEFAVSEYRQTNPWVMTPKSLDDGPPLVREATRLDAGFAVHDRDEPPGWIVTDESLRPGVESRVWVSPARRASAAQFASGQAIEKRPWEIGVRVVSGAGDVPVDYRIVLRRGGQERTLRAGSSMMTSRAGVDGKLTAARGFTFSADELPDAAPGADPMSPVTVILRPDLKSIAERLDTTPVWGREIVLENVPMRRMEDEQAGRDWQSGPWHAPNGSVIDPDAKFFANAPPTTRPASRPTTAPAASAAASKPF